MWYFTRWHDCISYTTTEPTIQMICCCKKGKKSTRVSARFWKMQSPPCLLSCLATSLPDSTVAKSSWVTGWRAKLSDRLRPQAETPAPLYFLPSGPGPAPTSWEHGAERLQPTALWEWHNERVHRKSRVGVWLRRRWSCPCSFGSTHGLMCRHQSRQKSKRCSINLALHHNLYPNDFWQPKNSFLFVPFCYCSFGVHMRVSDADVRGEHISWKQILKGSFLITWTQQNLITCYSCSCGQSHHSERGNSCRLGAFGHFVQK